LWFWSSDNQERSKKEPFKYPATHPNRASGIKQIISGQAVLTPPEPHPAEMTGVDLRQEVEAKITRNASRIYRNLPNGAPVKDDAGTEE
jgi:hypothetical protein